MKKVLSLAFVAVLAIGVTSCGKDYTCTCSIGGVETVTEYEGLNKEESEAAEAACNLQDAFLTDPDGCDFK